LYAIQLQEKQKIARFYNIRNSQLRHYVRKAHKLGGATTQVLQVMLECRFDNIIRRLRWARTIWQARQMVSHGHFLINGKKVDLPSLSLKAGEIDKITEFYTR
jgi:small subunit ribosomal protein S4